MKKFTFILIAIILVSCLKEPIKESEASENNLNNDLNTEIVIDTIIPEIIDRNYIIEVETEKMELQKESIYTYINEFNIILSNSQSIDFKLSLIDESQKVLLLGIHEFNVNDVYLIYEQQEPNSRYGRHYLIIECIKRSSGSNCIYVKSDNISSLGFPVDTKENCDLLIKIFESLKKY